MPFDYGFALQKCPIVPKLPFEDHLEVCSINNPNMVEMPGTINYKPSGTIAIKFVSFFIIA